MENENSIVIVGLLPLNQVIDGEEGQHDSDGLYAFVSGRAGEEAPYLSHAIGSQWLALVLAFKMADMENFAVADLRQVTAEIVTGKFRDPLIPTRASDAASGATDAEEEESEDEPRGHLNWGVVLSRYLLHCRIQEGNFDYSFEGSEELEMAFLEAF